MEQTDRRTDGRTSALLNASDVAGVVKINVTGQSCSIRYLWWSFEVRLFGSRPSDHYFRSVCLSVCLCRVFLSRL